MNYTTTVFSPRSREQRGERSFSIAPGISSSVPRPLADTSECRFAAPQSSRIHGSKPVLQDAWEKPPKKPSRAESPSAMYPASRKTVTPKAAFRNNQGAGPQMPRLLPLLPGPAPRGYQLVGCRCVLAFLNRLLDSRQTCPGRYLTHVLSRTK